MEAGHHVKSWPGSWPEVSTSWAAHGMLVDCLFTEIWRKGYSLQVKIESEKHGVNNIVNLVAMPVRNREDSIRRGCGVADSTPLAFAMAVSDLADKFVEVRV